jgi:hypothetical protein
MTHKLLSIAIVVAAAFACSAAAAAPTDRPCFASNSWDGWNASADGDALYLRVSMRDIYRVELTPGSHVRKDGFRFLINQVRGSNWICSPLDLDLTLSDHNGFREPLIARSLRKLTPAEIAAIPRKDLP